MKWVITCSAVLFAVSSFAMPKVGDRVVYVTSTSTGGSPAVTTRVTQELISFDAAANEFTVRQTIAFPTGTPQVTTTVIASDAIPSTDVINQILSSCAMMGGVTERVAVGRTNVDTCKMVGVDTVGGEQGTIWIGMVPFGTVKSESVTTAGPSVRTSMALESFVLGR